VYSLHYHLILTIKYRRGVLTEERTQFIRGVIGGFADKYGVTLTNLNGEDDHVHILFRAEPTTDLVKFINTVKGVTARRIRNEYEMKGCASSAPLCINILPALKREAFASNFP